MRFIPVGTIVTFIANGKQQRFELLMSSTIDAIEESILEKFVSYREESLCFDGISYMFPNIKSGYAIVEGKIADRLEAQGLNIYYSLKNVKDILKFGIRKGDTLHLGGVSSFTISSVDYGDRMLSLSLE